MSQKIRCAIAGLAAGLSNGFFGAGGGMLLVPIFTRLAKIDDRRALASSVAVILPLSLVSAVVYGLKLGFDFPLALPYLIGGLAGGLAGGLLFKRVPAVLLRRAFALLILYGGVRFLL